MAHFTQTIGLGFPIKFGNPNARKAANVSLVQPPNNASNSDIITTSLGEKIGGLKSNTGGKIVNKDNNKNIALLAVVGIFIFLLLK